jgi:hypothetical protein
MTNIESLLMDVGLPSELTEIMLLFIFGAFNKRELQLRTNHPELQKALLAKGSIMREDKREIYNAYCKRISNEYDPYIKTDLKRLLGSYKSTGFPNLSTSGYTKLVNYVYEETKTWINKFVFKKMKFIAQSSDISYDDMNSMLFEHGLKNLYLMYPRFESPLHAVNLAKNRMHAEGINFIVHQTCQKNNRFIHNDDGTFEARFTDIQPHHAFINENHDFGILRETKKYDKVIRMLAGEHSKSFTLWLKYNTSYNKDNDDLAEELPPDQYFDLVAYYTRQNPDKLRSCLKKIM